MVFPSGALVFAAASPSDYMDPFMAGTPIRGGGSAAEEGGAVAEELSRRIDLAVYEYLLNETQDRFESSLPEVLEKAIQIAETDPTRVAKLTSPPSADWKDPWKRLEMVTTWLAKADSYDPAPSQRYKELRHPRMTRIEVAKELHSVEPIAANRVGENCIASQYPFATLGAAELTLRCACEEKAIIIDLTQDGEMGISLREAYCPPKVGDEKEYKNMRIKYLAIDGDGAKVYEVEDRLSGITVNLRRYQCEEWEDHTAPSYELLNKLVALMERYSSEQKLVHCKAGVGRTGTLLACYMLAGRIASGSIHPGNVVEEVVKVVGEIRRKRCSTCVETKAQFDQIIGFVRARLEEIRAAREVVAAPAAHAAAAASGI